MTARTRHPISLSLLLALAATCIAGCASRPNKSSYRNVDVTKPEFQAAVARETAVETAKGKDADEAAKIATKRVTREAVATEKQRRTDEVAPLTAALTDLQRARGCWTYLLTTTTTKAEGVLITTERYDPHEPEEKLWTLLSFNGEKPTDQAQADYRASRLKAWKKQLARAAKEKPVAEKTTRRALYSDLSVTHDTEGGPGMYRFNREAAHVPLIGDLPASREAYLVDETHQAVLHHQQTYLGETSIFGGAMKILTWDTATDYTVIEPALPPFIAKAMMHYQAHLFGRDSGDVVIVREYSDYRRVKCYDDRFEVKIGEPTTSDLLPE